MNFSPEDKVLVDALKAVGFECRHPQGWQRGLSAVVTNHCFFLNLHHDGHWGIRLHDYEQNIGDGPSLAECLADEFAGTGFTFRQLFGLDPR